MTRKEIGARIKAIRDEKNITLKAMGELLSVGLTTYSSRENRGNFSEGDLTKILKKLGINKDQLAAYEMPPQGSHTDSVAEALISIEAKARVSDVRSTIWLVSCHV